MIDLRSDTLTRPTEAMRQAMADAEVNDDVIDTDPTVQKLQEHVAELLGKDVAMFMPSGTMTNQVAVRLHCQPGDELICEEGCHIYNYEQGAYAALSGVAVRAISAPRNILRLTDVQNAVRPDNEHAPRTRLLCLENTHNKGGGRVLPLDEVQRLCDWAHERGLQTHLDGARLFNAVVASGVSAKQWCEKFDTVSVCFSKGLGAPVGSALAGPAELLPQMVRHRKLFGGGMRQSGIIAAGALHALEHHVQRLAEDHAMARHLAMGLSTIEGLTVDPADVESNIVIFQLDAAAGPGAACSAAAFCDQLKENGVWVFPFSHCHVRAVTHMHLTIQDIDTAIERIASQVPSLHTA